MKTKNIFLYRILPLVGLICWLPACKKFVDVPTPPTKTSTENAFSSDYSATGVITGIYAQLSNNYFNAVSLPATSFYEEMSADNISIYDLNVRTDLGSYYQNGLEPNYSATYDQTYWKSTYQIIYTVNASIEALFNHPKLSQAVGKRLLGEAYFLRAFCYFYLVNLYGDVPLAITTDYKLNANMLRSPVFNVYTQINSDLDKAQELLAYNYVKNDAKTTYSVNEEERVRPNLAAVNALQARAFLYQKNYAAAEAAATKVINQTNMYSLGDLSGVFLKNSSETIWALQPVTVGLNTYEGAIYTIPADGPNADHPLIISTSLKNSFEKGDDRKTKWLDSVTIDNAGNKRVYVYPAKYKLPRVFIPTDQKEYTIVLRLSEQYLIRAEARNEQGNAGSAAADLNALRYRSRGPVTQDVADPLPAIRSNLTKEQMSEIILHERRVELFTEWGHRWFDLKRSNTLDAVMTQAQSVKGGQWQNYKSLYPIPVSDIKLNAALTQNQGYIK